MRPAIKPVAVLCAVLAGVFWAGTCRKANASPAIAKVTEFKGSALIMSGTTIRPITRTGLPLKAGDRIQTKEGSVEVVFNDGAIINVHSYTSTMIEEQEETVGFGFWKKKVSVRRVTCFIGKLWFKSGLSKVVERKNYLQTPTAVCGLRGSDGDIGFDGIQTYLNMYSGDADTVGDVLIGFFENPGAYVAETSEVYNSLSQASVEYEKARASGNPDDIKAAVAMALEAAVAAGDSLTGNPDKDVAEKGREIKKEAQKVLDAMGVLPPKPDPEPKKPKPKPEPEPKDETEDDRKDDPCAGAHPCDLNCDGEISYQEAQMCGDYISQ